MQMLLLLVFGPICSYFVVHGVMGSPSYAEGTESTGLCWFFVLFLFFFNTLVSLFR